MLADGRDIPSVRNKNYYATCQNNELFTQYTDGMRWCLQAYGSAQYNLGSRPGDNPASCKNCTQFVNGSVSGNIFDGVIGSHNDCNSAQEFCRLAGDPGRDNDCDGTVDTPPALQCFAAGLGFSWGATLGSMSPVGALESVGLCHLMMQATKCGPQMTVGQFHKLWNNLCTGYQDGCMANAGFGSDGTAEGQAMNSALCALTCPTPTDIQNLGMHTAAISNWLFGECAPWVPSSVCSAWTNLNNVAWWTSGQGAGSLLSGLSDLSTMVLTAAPNTSVAQYLTGPGLEQACSSAEEAITGIFATPSSASANPALSGRTSVRSLTASESGPLTAEQVLPEYIRYIVITGLRLCLRTPLPATQREYLDMAERLQAPGNLLYSLPGESMSPSLPGRHSRATSGSTVPNMRSPGSAY